MPFVVIMGLEAVVYTLNLSSSGLYVVNEAASISIPTSVSAIKTGNIEDMVLGLEILKVKRKHQLLLLVLFKRLFYF